MTPINIGKMGVGCMLLAFGLTSMAMAAKTDVILDLEGNPGCSQLVDNSVITELRDNSPAYGSNGPFQLSNAPYQCINYELDTVVVDGVAVDVIKNWTTDYCAGSGYSETSENAPAIYPVNMVVFKARGSAGARVWHYGARGNTSDSTLIGPGDATAVTFCTGLNDAIVEPPQVQSCDGIGGGIVNEVLAVCEGLSGKQATVHVVTRDPISGKDSLETCTCNRVAFKCDPTEENSFTSCVKPQTDEVLRQVPGVIKHINNGSFFCDDFSGTSECYSFGAFGF